MISGDTGLVVCAKKRGAVRRDDVVADLIQRSRMVCGADHLGAITRQHNVLALIVADDLGLDVRAGQSGAVSICEQKQITGTRLVTFDGIVA